MTEKKLEELNKLSNSIKYLQRQLKSLDYLERNKLIYEEMYFATDNSKIAIRIPKSLHTLIYNELRNKLESQLNDYERKFKQEG